jgi:hypothetical protein
VHVSLGNCCGTKSNGRTAGCGAGMPKINGTSSSVATYAVVAIGLLSVL